MARYIARIRSPKSPPEAFGYLADLTNFAQWDEGVVSAEQVTGAGPGLGAEVDVAVKSIGSDLTLRYETVRFDPPGTVVAHAQSRMLTSHDTITVVDDEGGSVVTYDAELTLNGPFRLADPLLGLAFGRIGDRATAGLVDALEGERLDRAG